MGERSPRTAHGQDWVAQYRELRERDARDPLGPDDLEHLAVAAFLLGHDDEVVTLRERGYERYLAEGRVAEAARCAFWLGFHLVNQGDFARSSGLKARVRRVLGPDTDPTGRLDALFLQADAAAKMMTGDPAGAEPLFEEATRLAERADDVDAYVLARLGTGRCLAMRADPVGAIAVLDEVMSHVAAGTCAPQVTGLAYCSMIELCMRRLDLHRAHQWTEALGQWCSEQDGMVPYRGTCQVHRADILHLRGEWSRAAEQARSLLERSGEASGIVAGASYLLAEIDRLQGRFASAETFYTDAARHGLEVQPGLALLRAAQGDHRAALVGLDRALVEDVETRRRPVLQAARVEIAVTIGDLDAAEAAANDLARLAAEVDVPYLSALAAHAAGAVALARDDPRSAIVSLRRASVWWQQVRAPHEGARTRLLLADACHALGDDDAARMETVAARTVLAQLGAVTGTGDAAPPVEPAGRAATVEHGLTARELEVLRLVATGATNRAIASALVLSEKTVARHLANIFSKLDVSSRAAATAYAYRHALV